MFRAGFETRILNSGLFGLASGLFHISENIPVDYDYCNKSYAKISTVKWNV